MLRVSMTKSTYTVCELCGGRLDLLLTAGRPRTMHANCRKMESAIRLLEARLRLSAPWTDSARADLRQRMIEAAWSVGGKVGYRRR